MGWKSMDCVNLPQDIDKWQVLVNMVMQVGVPYLAGNF
jgi:hypothetical protein